MANQEISQDSEAGVNRRNLLKGAVAAGVGVVAWSSPTVTAIAQTPGYASVCTGGVETFVLDYRNTACNCGSAQDPLGKYVSYKDPGNTQQCPVDNVVPREVTFWKGNAESYGLLGNSGTCPPDPATNPAGAYARIAPDPDSTLDYEFCRLKVESMDGNCNDLDVLATAYSDIVSEGVTQYVAMPRVYCQGAGDVFLRVSLECSNDFHCFPGV